MIIGIDIGNSTTCIGLFNVGTRELSLHIRIPNKELGDIKSWFPKEKVKAIIIASVVPDKNEVFYRVIQGFYGIIPKFIEPSLIKGAYHELGADRVANLIGGRELFGLPVCVIDFGTATTIDILSSDEEYIGGVILPGVSSGLQSLWQNTSLLPEVSLGGAIREIPPPLGKSTRECIISGAYWGEFYRIQGLVGKIKEKLNSRSARKRDKPKFVCTGGAGEVFAKSLSLKYEPLLTLWGLYFAGERSEK